MLCNALTFLRTIVVDWQRLIVFMFKGIFFILPCVDNYARVDLRTRTYDVPPQEVNNHNKETIIIIEMITIACNHLYYDCYLNITFLLMYILYTGIR